MSRSRFTRSRTRPLAVALVLAALVIIRAAGWLGTTPPPETLSSGVHQVERVVDGDTLRLASGARLRLQGIDAPETKKENHPVEAWGPEAAAYTRSFIQQADHRVRIEFGPERKDRYGRFLGFVFHGDRLLNEELVAAGLARATTQYHFSASVKRRLVKAETEAQDARRGIWSAPAE